MKPMADKKKPLEKLKGKVSPGSTAGMLRDRKRNVDAQVNNAVNGGMGKKK